MADARDRTPADDERPRFKAACVQMRSGLDRSRNVEAALALIAEAAARDAHLVVTPEMTTVLDRKAARLIAGLPDGEPAADLEAFGEAAAEHAIWLLVGSMPVRRGDGRLANRSYLFGPDGGLAARYDKIHMFDVTLDGGESWRESALYAPGEAGVVVETPLATLGLTICYDVRFPHLYRALARAGAEILCVPAAFTRQTGRAHWKALLTARAIETGSWVVAAAQGGVHEDGRETFGHSLIVSPWGEVVAEAKGEDPGVVIAEIDLARVTKARGQIPNLGLDQAFEITKLEA